MKLEAKRAIAKKLRVLSHAEESGNVSLTCRYFGISRDTFYRWRKLYIYIKKGSPHLNGKVERSHRTDKEEFYQLLSYKGDQDLEKKLKSWQDFYNMHRPHGAHDGKSPFEILKEKLKA